MIRCAPRKIIYNNDDANYDDIWRTIYDYIGLFGIWNKNLKCYNMYNFHHIKRL